MKFWKGYELCDKCGFVKMEKSACCNLNKMPVGDRLEYERFVLKMIDEDTSECVICRDMAISKGSVSRIQEYNATHKPVLSLYGRKLGWSYGH